MSSWLWRVFLVWYAVGIVLVSFDLVPPPLEWANALFLYLAGLVGGMYLLKRFGTKKGAALSLFIIIWSIAVESFGTKTGLVFGAYHYEKDFGVHLFGVPITIGFAWLLVTASSLALISPQPVRKKWTYPVFASLLAVAMDLVIDPVAYHLKQYWVWDEPGLYFGIPAQNFIGWFFTALSIHLVLYMVLDQPKPTDHHEKRAQLLYALVLLLFAVTAVVGGIQGAAAASVVLALAVWGGSRFV